tara:strand:- start:185 stop:1366 length:1182 start_codon:yes stop_codon:yes gene_type:complete
MSEETVEKQVPQEGEFKMKKKRGRPRKLANKKDDAIKVELNKKEEDAVQEPVTENSVPSTGEESKEERKEAEVELQPVGETHSEEQTSSDEVKEEEKIVEEIIETPVEAKATTPTPEVQQTNVPENLESLVKFMKETGGTVEDYVNLNKDYTDVDDSKVLREYYSKTKSHLDREEIDFLLDDKFSWDESMDDERTVKMKKLAYKEEVANARKFLEDSKGDYYKEIKLRSNITPEQQEAMKFWDAYKQNQEEAAKMHGHFKTKTVEFFKGNFNGFNFDVGEKSFRYKLSNPEDTANRQSDLRSVFKKFLNDKGEVIDYSGYHKAIYAASNSDSIAKHFYEQGKADATKDLMAKSKNINDGKPRATSGGDMYINGLKVKAITGVDASKLKIKKRT